MTTAVKLARGVAAKSPMAIKLAEHTLNTIEELSLRDGYRFEQTLTFRTSQTEDSTEARRLRIRGEAALPRRAAMPGTISSVTTASVSSLLRTHAQRAYCHVPNLRNADDA